VDAFLIGLASADRHTHSFLGLLEVGPRPGRDAADVVVPNEGKRELVEMRWGLVPYWWNKPLKELRLATFNARVETVTTKPFFREPFKKKRCLMPVSGYFEWEDAPGGKQPHYFTARDGSPVLTIAGLWDEWKNRETSERIKSCTMIITEPNDFVAEVHDRMPVLLRPDQFDHWLSGNMKVEASEGIRNEVGGRTHPWSIGEPFKVVSPPSKLAQQEQDQKDDYHKPQAATAVVAGPIKGTAPNPAEAT